MENPRGYRKDDISQKSLNEDQNAEKDRATKEPSEKNGDEKDARVESDKDEVEHNHNLKTVSLWDLIDCAI